MFRVLLSVIILNLLLCGVKAQDTIMINGQPDWNDAKPIFDNCGFFEDKNDDPLDFAAVKHQHFVPYIDSLRRDVTTLRPQIIQWLRFTIRNTSPSDTIRLLLNPGAHYFTEFFDENGWLASGGVYEGRVSGVQRIVFNVTLLPDQQKTFWLQTRERQGNFTPHWISLETSSSFTKSQLNEIVNSRLLFLLLAFFTGCLFFITVFALYQYILFKDKAFLWYIAYTLSATLTGLFWIDIRHQFGIFSSFTLDLIFSIFLFLIPVLYTLFIGEMLRFRQQFKKGWRLVQFLLMIAILQMLIEFFTIRTGKFIFNDYYGYFVSMVPVTILNVVLLVLTAKSREKIKWFMFCGLVSMLLLWCLPLMLSPLIAFKAGLVHYVVIFVPFYFLMGLTIEAICFAFALSYRSKLIYTEKNNLQKEYRSQLQGALDKRTAELQAKNKILEVQKIEQVKTAFGKKMAEAEMNALRAQMNPHFIFNCLNSIKLYTIENDSKAASEYLTLFSQLIRLVLENSRSEKISLKKELETVELYIKLEAMRFKDKVGYSISVSPAIDTQYTELPPLLIQPYIENAIWHGLMHKKEGGCIKIQIDQQDDDTLLIEITDNGIGREQAAIYKSKSATSQKSFGLKMTADRIEIINQIYGINAEVIVIDLKDDRNQSTGTKVMIKIPV